MTLETRSLYRSFGRKRVLEDVSAEFPTGLTLLTGPSGAGKSTLLRLLATADTPSKGHVVWNGKTLPGAKRSLRRVLGYAPQIVDLPESLTAREFALHIAALKGLAIKKAQAQFASIAERMNLLTDIDRPIMGFSGGMRRRLVTAQALLGDPQVIALDEPTAELDADNAAIIHELLLERTSSAAVIMTTHLSRALEDQARQILHVDSGKVTARQSGAQPVT